MSLPQTGKKKSWKTWILYLISSQQHADLIVNNIFIKGQIYHYSKQVISVRCERGRFYIPNGATAKVF